MAKRGRLDLVRNERLSCLLLEGNAVTTCNKQFLCLLLFFSLLFLFPLFFLQLSALGDRHLQSRSIFLVHRHVLDSTDRDHAFLVEYLAKDDVFAI